MAEQYSPNLTQEEDTRKLSLQVENEFNAVARTIISLIADLEVLQADMNSSGGSGGTTTQPPPPTSSGDFSVINAGVGGVSILLDQLDNVFRLKGISSQGLIRVFDDGGNNNVELKLESWQGPYLMGESLNAISQPTFFRFQDLSSVDSEQINIDDTYLVTSGDNFKQIKSSDVGAGKVFTFNSATTPWTIAHNFGRRVTVDIYTLGGALMWGSILHLNLNEIEISFTEPTAGYAVIQ